MCSNPNLVRFNLFFPKRTYAKMTSHLKDAKAKRVLRGGYTTFIIEAVEEKLAKEAK